MTTTFHPFPRLPLELRIQIWASAFDDDRVVKVRWAYSSGIYWSPTPAPAVTRACHESRKYCSYEQSFIFQKPFISDNRLHFIWVNYDHDILQMLGSTMSLNMAQARSEIFRIRRLRIEIGTETEPDDDGYQAEFFCHNYSLQFRELPLLQGCDVLVRDRLSNWGSFIDETYWGVCPKSNVRIVDAKTGEWIDIDSAGPYVDWMDNRMGIDPDDGPVYTRIDDFWDAEDEEDVKNRYEAMMKMKDGLPRIDLNY